MGGPEVVPDRREVRHARTRDEIIAAAWRLAHDHGLTGWSLREVAAAVGMRAPSLYGYFPAKDAIYDAMFAQGYEQLLAMIDRTEVPEDPDEALRVAARSYLAFCTEDAARFQLLFLRVVPGFEPRRETFALAERVLDGLLELLGRAGIHRRDAADLWTAILTGIAVQQLSNDPGGDRWTRLADDAADMFLAATRDRS